MGQHVEIPFCGKPFCYGIWNFVGVKHTSENLIVVARYLNLNFVWKFIVKSVAGR